MRLSRQVTLLIVVLLVLVLAGMLWIGLHDARGYLRQQLHAHAQDTATSLGLSLAPALAREDRALAETMVNAIFDRGYYRSIEVRGPEGEALIARSGAAGDPVPRWFAVLAALPAPQAESVVTSGWRQVGVVRVTANPAPAYRQLWDTAVHGTVWLVILAAAAVLAAAALLRVVLRPLRGVEQQAAAIAEGAFPIQETLPRTPELRRVVEAMNLMSGKVRTMLEGQTRLAEEMRARAHEDMVTGLQNRRSFETRMGHLLDAPEEVDGGALALVSLDDFRTINQRHGYDAGDALLRDAARALTEACGEGQWELARLGGADFAVFIYPITPEDLTALAGRMAAALGRLQVSGDAVRGHIGICYRRPGQTLTELLGCADTALRVARERGPGAWHLYAPTDGPDHAPPGRSAWQVLLEERLSRGDVVVQYQPVRTADGRLLHQEALARVRGDDGGLIPAGVFMPIARQLGMAGALDRAVIERLRHTLPVDSAGAVAVNVSASSLCDPQFIGWLQQILAEAPLAGGRFAIEISERGLAPGDGAVAAALGALRAAGTHYGLDHFGSTPGALPLLHQLRPDYIKLDGSYVRGIDAQPDHRFFVRSVTDIAHGLGVQVIAEYVETPAERDAVAALGLDGFQGHWIGAPGGEHGS